MTKPYIIKNKFGVFYFKDKACTIYHREDGPAIEYTNGDKLWYVNGSLHREDGPAYEFYDGTKEWYLNDERCLKEEHKRLVKMINFL